MVFDRDLSRTIYSWRCYCIGRGLIESLLHSYLLLSFIQIRSGAVGFCVDGSTDHKNYHKPVIGYPCHSQGGNQVEFFSINDDCTVILF